MRVDWKKTTLGRICEKTSNIKWTSHIGDDFEYIDLSSVSRDDLEIVETSTINSSTAPSRAKKIVFQGDIIFATTRPTLKRAVIIDQKYHNQICSTGYCVLRPLKDVALSGFIYYFLLSEDFMERMESLQRGASYPAVSDKDVLQTTLYIPNSLTEQKQIVAILDQAFAAINQAKANIEKNIENAKELFESRKKELFEILASEFTPIPLAEACKKIFAGGDAPKENFSKEKTGELNIPIIANAVRDNGLYGYTNEAVVIEPSITVAARGSGTGHTEYRDYPFVPIVRLIVLTPNTEVIDVEFLMHAVKSLTIIRSGSAIPQLTVPMIKGYSIPLPQLEKQIQIVNILNNLEEQLEAFSSSLTQKLTGLEELKKSILQKAFAGELTQGAVDEKLQMAAEPEEKYK